MGIIYQKIYKAEKTTDQRMTQSNCTITKIPNALERKKVILSVVLRDILMVMGMEKVFYTR